MTSRDEINPSKLPTDSLVNDFQVSHSLESNSADVYSSSSTTGHSDMRSENDDPITDSKDKEFQDENFKNPLESLTEGNLNSDKVFKDDDCSRDINPSKLPIDSQVNDFQVSHSLEFNSADVYSSTSTTGHSDMRSENDEPIKDSEAKEFQDENFMNPSEILTEGNLNSDNILKNDDCSQESSDPHLISFQHLNNSLPLDESVNGVETSFSESLISKYESFENVYLPETQFDEKEANQPKEMPHVSSSSTHQDDSSCINIKPSFCFGTGDNVTESEEIEKTNLEEIDALSCKNFETECTGDNGDYRSLEQIKFETPDDNIFDNTSENKSHHKQPGTEQNFYISSGTTSPQSIITGVDTLGGEDYLSDTSSMVDKNDFNPRIRPEFASNEIKSGQEIGDHGNPLEIRKHCDSGSTTRNIDTQLSHLNTDGSNELDKYQELKSITDDFFKLHHQSLLQKAQRKETIVESETEIKTTTTPLVVRLSSSIDKNYHDNPRNNNEPTDALKFDRQILDKEENLTEEILSSSVDGIANSNLTDKSDSGKEGNCRIVSKTGVDNNKTYDFHNYREEHDSSDSENSDSHNTEFNSSLNGMCSLDTESGHYPVSLKTTDDSCLKKETEVFEPSQIDNITDSLNIFTAETNDIVDCRQILKTERPNFASTSTANLNPEQCKSMTADYGQMEDNLADQGLISDKKQNSEVTDVDEDTQRNICIIEPKCSSIPDSATQPFIKESKMIENFNNETPTLFEKNIGIKNSDKDPDHFTSKEPESKNMDIFKIREHSSESLHGQENTPEFKRDEIVLLESHSIPISVPKSNKSSIIENQQSFKNDHRIESSPLENESICASDSHEDIKKSRNVSQEDINSKSLLPSVELVSQEIPLRRSQRLLNLSNRNFNAERAVATANQKEMKNIGAEKQTSKRTSTRGQTVDILRDSKKLKSCQIQSKSLRPTCQTVVKGDFVSTHNSLKKVMTSDARSPSKEAKQTSKRISEYQIVDASQDTKKLKSCKMEPKSHRPSTSQTVTEAEFVSTENSRKTVKISDVRSPSKEEKHTSERISKCQRVNASQDTKKLNSCKVQPKSLRQTCQTVTKGNFVSTANLQETAFNSDSRSPNEESISSPFLRMAEVLRKYDNKRQESTTSNNEFEFGPRIITDETTEGNASGSLSSSESPTVLDCTVAAVKQLNNGNGSTILDIVSYVRTNLPSSEKKLSHDIRKALKDATAAGFLTYDNGKYKETIKPIAANTSKEPTKRKSSSVNFEDKTLSKRVKATPTQTHSLRPKTTRLTTTTKRQKDDSGQ